MSIWWFLGLGVTFILGIIANTIVMRYFPRYENWLKKRSLDRLEADQERQTEFDQEVAEVMKSTHNLIYAHARNSMYQTSMYFTLVLGIQIFAVATAGFIYWDTVTARLSGTISFAFFFILVLGSMSMMLFSNNSLRKFSFLSQILDKANRLANPEDDQEGEPVDP